MRLTVIGALAVSGASALIASAFLVTLWLGLAVSGGFLLGTAVFFGRSVEEPENDRTEVW